MKLSLRSGISLLAGLFPLWVSAAPASLVIDPAQSRVEIIVKATVDSFTGKLDAYKVAVTVDNERVTAATFTFNFSEVRTGKDGRDEAMNEWQETPRYPEVRFTLLALTPTADRHFNARGTLVLHGISREIVFPVSVITDHTHYAIDGNAALDTHDFDLPIIRKFGILKVDPIVKVRFHLQGTLAADHAGTS